MEEDLNSNLFFIISRAIKNFCDACSSRQKNFSADADPQNFENFSENEEENLENCFLACEILALLAKSEFLIRGDWISENFSKNLKFIFEKKFSQPKISEKDSEKLENSEKIEKIEKICFLKVLVVKILALAIFENSKIFDVPKGTEFLAKIVENFEESAGEAKGFWEREYRNSILILLAVVTNLGVLEKNQADFMKNKLGLEYFGVVGFDLTQGLLKLVRQKGEWGLEVRNQLEYWTKVGKSQEIVLPVFPEKYFVLNFYDSS